jgi:hypothetical protein
VNTAMTGAFVFVSRFKLEIWDGKWSWIAGTSVTFPMSLEPAYYKRQSAEMMPFACAGVPCQPSNPFVYPQSSGFPRRVRSTEPDDELSCASSNTSYTAPHWCLTAKWNAPLNCGCCRHSLNSIVRHRADGYYTKP